MITRLRWESHSVRIAAILIVAGCGVVAVSLFRDMSDRLESVDRIILITIDTLRADHLGCYGYPRETSPFLDRLAESGVLFEKVISSCSLTSPAHATLFTSLQPVQHGVLHNGLPLDSTVVTIAELFRSEGYHTAAVNSVGFMEPLAQGFDHFDGDARTANMAIDQTIAWLS